MKWNLPFESPELDEMRRRQRELLVAIPHHHLFVVLEDRHFAKVGQPDDCASPRWVGAEPEVRQLIDRLLEQPETMTYAEASIALHAANLRMRSLELVTELEWIESFANTARDERTEAQVQLDRLGEEMTNARQDCGQLIGTLLLAEIVANDEWTFAPLRDALTER